MTTPPLTPARRRSITIAVFGVELMGFGQLFLNLAGHVDRWFNWVMPIFLWAIAYISYQRYLKVAPEKLDPLSMCPMRGGSASFYHHLLRLRVDPSSGRACYSARGLSLDDCQA